MSKRTIKEKTRRRAGRRQSRLLVIGGIVAAALVVVALIIIGNSTNSFNDVDTKRYNGIPQAIDKSGAPGVALGSPQATATLVEYADFSCPHCREMYDTIHELVDPYVRTNKLRIIYKPVFFIDPAYSPGPARALLCAASQGKGWEMHDQIWAVYDVYNRGGYNLDVFGARAGAIQLDVGQFRTCYNSAETTTMLNEIDSEANKLGVSSTPTLFLNGQVISSANVAGEVQAAVGN